MAKTTNSRKTSKITVGLAHGRGFLSWCIENLPTRRGEWSHCVALVLPGGMEVIDARSDKVGGKPPGVQIRPISYLKGTKCLWLDIPCTPAQAKATRTALESVLNRPYDFKGIRDFATGQTDNSWKTKADFFCSALGIWGLWQGSILTQEVLVPFTDIDPPGALRVYWGAGARPAATPAALLEKP